MANPSHNPDELQKQIDNALTVCKNTYFTTNVCGCFSLYHCLYE
jgi:hypothetical protein